MESSHARHRQDGRSASDSWSPWLVRGVLALTLATLIAFAARYATAMPLTDEWAFVRSVMEMQDVDRSVPGWGARLLEEATLRFNGHVVVLPFFAYALLAPLVDFDQRLFIGLTIACFALQVLLYRRWIGAWSPALIPIAVMMLGLGHYMEFLWGFEITLTLSIALPLAGLALIDSSRPEDSAALHWRRLCAGLLLILLGAFSSLGGLFAFPAALLLVALMPLPWRQRIAQLAAVAIATLAVANWVLPVVRGEHAFGARQLLQMLTALGGLIWGTPQGLMEFGLDARSLSGLLILLALGAVLLRAIAQRKLARIAFPLACVLFGLLSLASIAVARSYVGNWHLQYGLPVVCGAYLCAYAAWRDEPRARATRLPFAALSVILLAASLGTLRAFTRHGPDYRAYVEGIENYALASLRDPALQRPFPPAPELGADLLLYLSANGHALFDKLSVHGEWRDASQERVFIGENELLPPRQLAPAGRHRLITVLIPAPTATRNVMLEFGGQRLSLRRVHRSLIKVPDTQGFACFAGMLLSGVPARGAAPLQVRLAN